MLRYHLLFSLRNLWRFRSTTALQVVGFVIGLAALLPAMMVVYYHLRFDKFHHNYERIARLSTVVSLPASESTYAATSRPLARLLSEQLPGLEEVVRCRYMPASLRVGGKDLGQSYPLFADPAFFRVFNSEPVAGDVATALSTPDGLVVNETTATRLFADADPIGQTVELETPVGSFSVQVKAVVKDYPENVSFRFDMVAGLSHVEQAMQVNLGALVPGHFTYVMMQKKVDRDSLHRQLARMTGDHFPEGLRDVMSLLAVPYEEVHYTTGHQFDSGRKGSKLNNLALGMMVVFLLLVSIANFVNLSTALLMRRSKELTIRRMMGERAPQQYVQLLIESAGILALVILIVGLATSFIVPEIEAMMNITLRTGPFAGYFLYAFIVLFGMLVAGISSAIPFLLMRGTTNLAGNRTGRNASGGLGVRYSLLTLQLIVSVFFAVIALGMDEQLRYIKSSDLGFERDNVVTMSISDPRGNAKADAIKEALLRQPGVEAVSLSLTPITGDHVRATFRLEADTSQAAPMMNVNYVDADFADVYKVRLLAGRFFSRDYATDRGNAFILNMKAVEDLGLSSAEEAIGKTFSKVLGDSLNTGSIVGVVENYHFQSLYQELEPMVWQIVPSASRNLLAIKLAASGEGEEHLERKMADLAAVVADAGIEQEVEFTSLTEALDNAYSEDDRLSFFIRVSAGVIVMIALLGVFGLGAFILETRKKEMGIRKLLGAGLMHIAMKMGKPFWVGLLIALAAGTPLSYYFLGSWLNSFAYHVETSWWYMPMAGLMIGALMVLAIFNQVNRAAKTNPAEVLREE